jgi:hypothetical protein
MPRQITPGASFWVRLKGEVPTGDGSGDDAQNPLTYEQANSDIGQVGDQPASADSGSFSLLSLFQRLLLRITLVYKDVPSNGTAVKVAIVEGGGGSVAVSNFPATQPVSGSVEVTNHPTEIQISNLPATQPVSGTVTVANPVTSVAVSNLPATQPVSGSLAVTNFPATQPVSGTVTANAGTNLNTSALALEAGNLATVATNTAAGTAITGATIPTGGVGRIGWLSAIWQQISTKLPTLVSGRIPVQITPLTATNFASQADVQAVRDRLITGGPSLGAGTAAAAERTGINSMIQGPSSDMTLLSGHRIIKDKQIKLKA